MRLVAPLEQRIGNIQDSRVVDRASAERLIEETDQACRRYVRENFEAEIDDPLAYHLTVNTGRLDYAEAAKVIGEAALCQVTSAKR